MSDLLIQSLKAQARLHHKAGSHGLGKLFDCAVEEIEQLKTQLEKRGDELESIGGVIRDEMEEKNVKNFTGWVFGVDGKEDIEVTAHYVNKQSPSQVIESLRSQLATAKADGIREAVKSSVQWDCFEISLCTAEKVEEWSWIKTERLLDFANQLNKEQDGELPHPHSGYMQPNHIKEMHKFLNDNDRKAKEQGE